ncbi:MAG: sigma-70 family RNA polymerase sigma factor [Bacteroidota bacterium]
MSINPMYHHTPEKLKEEREWIQEAKNRPENFGPLYKKYHEPIFRYVYQRMNDKEFAYDIVSQVFMKAMKNIHKFEDRGVPFSAWLFRIAKSEVYQSFRDNQAERYVNIETVQLVEVFEEMEEDDNEANIKYLLTALKSLKEKDIQLLEMRFFEKRSFKEIGEILELTENNAKVKTFRALEKLKANYIQSNKRIN